MRELDTFVQLFAAFYVTLSVENQIFRQFWTPGYYKTIANLLPKYGFRYSTRFQRQFTDKIQELSRDLETESRKKGTCMLLVCIVLLGCSIFMSDSATFSVSHSLSLTVYVILAFSGIVFSHYWFKRWRHVAIHGILSIFIAIAAGYIYTRYNYLAEGGLKPYEELLENVTKTCIILALTFPIIWQLFINWLYSEIYQRHLIRVLNLEADLYRKFWEAYMRNDQNEIPREYGGIIIAAFMNGRSDDLQVTDATNTLYERLLSACTRPRIHNLLCHIGKNCEGIRPIGLVDLNYLPDTDDQVPTRPTTRPIPQKEKSTGLRSGVQRPYKEKKKKYRINS